MGKKLFSVFLILVVSFSLFAFRTYDTTVKEYDSTERIRKFYSETELSPMLEEYWNSVEVSLVTISAGPSFYSWFGHTGIMASFPDGTSYLFDYGRFNFDYIPLKDFVFGRLWYWCGASDSLYQIQKSESMKRTMTQVSLNLSAEQKRALLNFLEDNCQEENCTYLYRPLIDNCSTRVRDVLNRITDGDFENWAKDQEGESLRSNVSRVVCRNVFVQWILDAIQGRDVDKKTTLWDEMFLPENLENAVLAYGKLGDSKQVIVDNSSNPKTFNSQESRFNYWYCLIVGLTLLVLSCIFFKHKKLWTWYSTIVNLFILILGCFIVFVMFFTIHDEMWNNENILFINPLIIIAVILGFNRDKHLKGLELTYFAFTEVTLLLVIGKIVFPNFFIQHNAMQIITFLPYFISNWYLLKKTGLNSVQGSAAENGNPLK